MARNRLAQRGLISFEKGNRCVTPSYTIICGNETGGRKVTRTGNNRSDTPATIPATRNALPQEPTDNPSRHAIEMPQASENEADDKKCSSGDSLGNEDVGTLPYTQDECSSEHIKPEIPRESYSQSNTPYKNKTKIKNKNKTKIKIKTKREGERVASDAPSPSRLLNLFEDEAVSEKYRNFCKWYRENAPMLSRTLRPMSEEEFTELCADFGSEAIADNIIKLENRNDLRGRYSALHPTLVNWCTRDRH